jgi:NAD(P)-dependent dehydrogenase (short-subunit alcohol dehydrogenase family)
VGELLKDKVAVVTGSGRGLGRAFAHLLAEEGARVVVNDLGGETDGTGASGMVADEVVKEIQSRGGAAAANYDSVASAQGGENIIKTALDNFGRIDILVNNAGIIRDRMFHNVSEEDWDIMLKVHLYGSYYCTKPAVIQMRQQKSGRIINIVSPAVFGNPGQSHYGAAKAGLLGLTRTLAREFGRNNITCNALIPSAPTRLSWTPDLDEFLQKRIAEGKVDPMQAALLEMKEMAPEDNAPLLVYLASDEAANINGCTFWVLGNRIHLYSDPVPVKTIYKAERFTVDDLRALMPKSLAADLVNPAPPAPPKEGK